MLIVKNKLKYCLKNCFGEQKIQVISAQDLDWEAWMCKIPAEKVIGGLMPKM